MLLFDRYLLRQFLWVWLICFCSLTGLYIVIDAFGNLEEFLSAGERTGRHFLVVMGEFYSYRALAFFDRTSGILTLIAAMFTLAGLQRYNELTALLAAGTSKWRIVQPLIVAGAIIALTAALNRELIMPQHTAKFSRTPQELNTTVKKGLKNPQDAWSGIVFQSEQLQFDTQTIMEPTLQLPRSLAVQGRTWQAATATYEAATNEHPSGYRLDKVTVPKELSQVNNLQLATGEVVIYTPRTANWLAADQAFVVSEMDFNQLVDPQGWRQYASTLELIAGLYNPGLNMGNNVRVTVHVRLLQPLLDVALLLLGLPLVLRGLNRNMFIAVGQCVIVVIGFLILTLTAHTLGVYFIAPVVGAWIPLLVFIPLAVFNGQPLWE